MNPIDFADKYLYPYKIKGQEIIPKFCPVCHGGDNSRDKETFALNVENMTFNCRRGSCGCKGTFNQLLKSFDEETFNTDYRILNIPRKKKEYKRPEVKSVNITDKVVEYFKSRGISEKVVKQSKVGFNGKNAMMFPYYKGDELVLVKYRTFDKKFWRTTDSEPVFWGLNEIVDFSIPLVIYEGEIDRLSAIECGIKNAVSVPSGSEDLECIENQWEILEKFKQIIIWNDKDEPGIEMRKKLIDRLGDDRCKYVIGKYKDCNEQLMKEGKESVLKTFSELHETPIEYAKKLEEYEDWNPDDQEFIKSGIKSIDESLGGFALGTVTIVSGKNGSGKSTLINQFVCESTDQDYKTMIFSGETQSQILRYQVELLFAGDENINKKSVHGMPDKYYVKKEVKDSLRKWYSDKIWVYDNIEADCSPNAMLRNMKSLYMRHNVKLFVIDNILSMNFDCDNEWKLMQQQSAYIRDCIIFAIKYNVAIIVVQHPTKTNERITKDTIKGTGDITNRVHGVILVHKLTFSEKKALAKAQNQPIEHINWDIDIEIAKNRHNGKTPIIPTYYKDSSRRLHSIGDNVKKRYGWCEPF